MSDLEIKKDFESVLLYWSQILGAATERNRLLILVALLDSDLKNQGKKSSLTFSQLLKITGMKRGDLNYHLEVLDRLGLIEGRNREPYRISKEGRKILNTLGVTEQLLLTFRMKPM